MTFELLVHRRICLSSSLPPSRPLRAPVFDDLEVLCEYLIIGAPGDDPCATLPISAVGDGKPQTGDRVRILRNWSLSLSLGFPQTLAL